VTRVASSFAQVPRSAVREMLERALARMRSAYRRRLELAADLLDAREVPYIRPAGAFYVLVDVSGSGVDDRTFALCLLDQHGVAVVPGSAFGRGAEGFVRVSLCVADEAIAEGLDRLAHALTTRTAA
jgi:aspartate/methionine/tyrosine aminotransferase